MTTNIYLTDEDSEVVQSDGTPYKRATLNARSDNVSLVRSVTTTTASGTGTEITRTAGGTVLAWITDPMSSSQGVTAAAWTLHMWAYESAATVNTSIRVQVLKMRPTGATTSLIDNNVGTELGLYSVDSFITSAAATATSFSDGDRLVINVLTAAAGTMGVGTMTFSYNGLVPYAEGDSYLVSSDTYALLASMPAATRLAVQRAIKDIDATSPLFATAEIDQAINTALVEYSYDRPRMMGEVYAGDGSTYDFPLPRAWVRNFSRITMIEYPTGNQIPTLLDQDDWELYDSSLGVQPIRSFRMRAFTPSSGNSIQLLYTTRHIHNSIYDTIPADDFYPFCQLAGSHALIALASKMAGASDSTITADSVDYRSSSDRLLSAAKALRMRYEAHVGVGVDTPGAGVIHDWDTRMSWGQDRLFHRRRIR